MNIDTAVPCGLLINELVSNCLKYAFPDNFLCEEPHIKITVNKLEELKYSLVISDNGIGLPENFNIKTSKSLGLKLVNSLVAQIEGDIKVNNEHGAEYVINFIDRDKVRTKQS